MRAITFCLITTINIVIIMFLMVYVFLTDDNITYYIGWMLLGIGVVVSLPLCYLSLKFIRLAALFIGLASGTALAFIF
jgi:hypothetical protein